MASSKTSELVAKRWAKALMELVLEDENISKTGVLSQMKDVVQTFEGSEELMDVVKNPSISTEEKQIIICKLFDGKVMPIVYNFLFVLNLRKRLGIISDIVNEFEKEIEEYDNIARVEVVSAIEIDDNKKEEIKTKISEKLNKSVVLDWNVDPDIIAGLIFNMNGTVVDNSVKHKLDNLAKKIMR